MHSRQGMLRHVVCCCMLYHVNYRWEIGQFKDWKHSTILLLDLDHWTCSRFLLYPPSYPIISGKIMIWSRFNRIFFSSIMWREPSVKPKADRPMLNLLWTYLIPVIKQHLHTSSCWPSDEFPIINLDLVQPFQASYNPVPASSGQARVSHKFGTCSYDL